VNPQQNKVVSEDAEHTPALFEDDTELEYDEYLDDEPVRKPKTGKSLRKFRIPGDR
jgi:hypothetical protein